VPGEGQRAAGLTGAVDQVCAPGTEHSAQHVRYLAQVGDLPFDLGQLRRRLLALQLADLRPAAAGGRV
jgi:hypothetical protein